MTTEQTIENKMYGVNWLKCSTCGMLSKDVEKDENNEPRCKNKTRCELAFLGKPLGGTPWGSSQGPNDSNGG